MTHSQVSSIAWVQEARGHGGHRPPSFLDWGGGARGAQAPQFFGLGGTGGTKNHADLRTICVRAVK